MDVLELASVLIRENTAGGHEARGARILLPLLADAGFDIQSVELEPGRPNIVATFRGGGDFILSGHLDTVSIDRDGWKTDPLDPHVSNGRLVGRGSSDMKGGLAAMVLAAIDHARRNPRGRGFSMAITSSEEAGCQGASVLRKAELLPERPILIIGESTSNEVRLGHKGATWLRASSNGVAAHGSRPELGINAISNLVQLAAEVERLTPQLEHPFLGPVTSNIGTIRGGTQTNMVPAFAELTIDLRTTPGTDIERFERELTRLVPRGGVSRILHLPPVWTNQDDDTAFTVNRTVASVTGRTQNPSGTAYFTDAAMLAPAHDPRVFILGPGDPDQPHTANESCSITRLEESLDVYSALLNAWTTGQFA